MERSEAEGFRQQSESDPALRIRFKQLHHSRIPFGEYRILPAVLPVRLAWCDGEKKQPVTVTLDGHANLVRPHARG